MMMMLLLVPAALVMLIWGGLPVGALNFGAYRGKVVQGHPILMRIAAILIFLLFVPLPFLQGAVMKAVLGGLALLFIVIGLFLGQ